MKRMNKQAKYELLHMDEFIDELLHNDRVLNISLPRMQKRAVLEELNEIEPHISALDVNLDDTTMMMMMMVRVYHHHHHLNLYHRLNLILYQINHLNINELITVDTITIVINIIVVNLVVVVTIDVVIVVSIMLTLY